MSKTTKGVKFIGVGKALPSYTMSNDEIATFLDTTDEWIQTRTGIKQRHISNGETTTDLAVEAAKAAISNANIDPEMIDLIIVATITPDEIMPSTACRVQQAIKAKKATAFDITAACSGFLYAMKVATDAIVAGSNKMALIIGAEVISKALNWEDRSTAVLFGDGAGAAILAQSEESAVMNIYTQSDGDGGDLLTLGARGVKNCIYQSDFTTPFIGMNGKEVYKFATTIVPKSIIKVLEDTSCALEDIDHFILHQANERIIASVAKRLKVPEEKFYKNLATHGNTSSASIPMALNDAKASFKKGDRIILCGFGGGLTWGSVLLEW